MRVHQVITIRMLLLLLFGTLQGQHLIQGEIIDANSLKPIAKVRLHIASADHSEQTNGKGEFTIIAARPTVRLTLSHPHYITQVYQLTIEQGVLDLGVLVLYPSREIFENHEDEIPVYKTNLISQYLRRYGADLPLNLRGITRKTWQVEHLPMTHLMDGKNQRDLFRGVFSLLQVSSDGSSDFLFSQAPVYFNFSRPSKKTSFSGSLGNQTYSGSLKGQVYYTLFSKKWTGNIVVTRRWAQEGYIDGSLYDGWGLGAVIQGQLTPKNTVRAALFYAPTRWGGHAPLTERVYQKMGAQYNPLWGMQLSLQRNSYISKSSMPLFFIRYAFHPNRWSITASLMGHRGKRSKSRLDYQNADNPFPDYWANQAHIENAPQLDWVSMYRINQNQHNTQFPGAAKYMVYDDVIQEKSLTAQLAFTRELGSKSTWSTLIVATTMQDANFAQPIDLLAASYYNDVNEFTLIQGAPAQNDLGNTKKLRGQKIKYNYTRSAQLLRIQNKYAYHSNKIKGAIQLSIDHNSFYRNGLFTHQAYPDTSFGKSKQLQFTPYTLASYLSITLGRHHQLNLSGTVATQAPKFDDSFISPREHNATIPQLRVEKQRGIAGSYTLKTTRIQAQLSTYWYRFSEGSRIQSFFANGGIGSHFFNVISTNLGRKHMGMEGSVQLQVSQPFSIHLAMALGQYIYDANPNIAVNYDPNALENNEIAPVSLKDLGPAYLKNYHLASGPEQFYGLALRYATPKYALQVGSNYYNNQYLQLSSLRRTSTFFINPLTNGQPFQEIDLTLAKALLHQEKLAPTLLVSAALSTWWRIKTLDFSLSASLKNILNTTYKINGYEQHRLASYTSLRDDVALGTQRNFGPKYTVGMPRTFSVQLRVKF